MSHFKTCSKLRVAAMEGFKEMAEVSPAVFAEICTPKYVIDLFTNPRYSNGLFLITFITILLKYLPAYGNSSKPVLIRVIRTLYLVTLIPLLLSDQLEGHPLRGADGFTKTQVRPHFLTMDGQVWSQYTHPT